MSRLTSVSAGTHCLPRAIVFLETWSTWISAMESGIADHTRGEWAIMEIDDLHVDFTSRRRAHAGSTVARDTISGDRVCGAACSAGHAAAIVQKADEVRFPSEAFEASVTIDASDGADATRKILSKGNDNTIVMVTEPAAERGQIMSMKGHDLWVFLPNVSQPVRLSLSQRLTGQAAQRRPRACQFFRRLRREAAAQRGSQRRDATRGAGAPPRARAQRHLPQGAVLGAQVEQLAVQGRVLLAVRPPVRRRCMTSSKRVAGRVRPTRLVMQDALRQDAAALEATTTSSCATCPTGLPTHHEAPRVMKEALRKVLTKFGLSKSRPGPEGRAARVRERSRGDIPWFVAPVTRTGETIYDHRGLRFHSLTLNVAHLALLESVANPRRVQDPCREATRRAPPRRIAGLRKSATRDVATRHRNPRTRTCRCLLPTTRECSWERSVCGSLAQGPVGRRPLPWLDAQRAARPPATRVHAPCRRQDGRQQAGAGGLVPRLPVRGGDPRLHTRRSRRNSRHVTFYRRALGFEPIGPKADEPARQLPRRGACRSRSPRASSATRERPLRRGRALVVPVRIPRRGENAARRRGCACWCRRSRGGAKKNPGNRPGFVCNSGVSRVITLAFSSGGSVPVRAVRRQQCQRRRFRNRGAGEDHVERAVDQDRASGREIVELARLERHAENGIGEMKYCDPGAVRLKVGRRAEAAAVHVHRRTWAGLGRAVLRFRLSESRTQ